MSKRPISRQMLWILLLPLVVLFYQNCSNVNGKFESKTKGPNRSFEAAGGNGDGYAGIRVDGPTSMKPGESAEVSVSGGAPPYRVQVAGQGTIQPIDQNRFLYSVSVDATPGTDVVNVRDSAGAKTDLEIEITTLQVSALKFGNFFGRDVVLKGNMAVIGASGYSQFAYASGAIFTFDLSTPQLTQSKIYPPISTAYSGFGSSLAYDGDHAIVSAASSGANGLRNVGKVFIYDVKDGKWDLLKSLSSPVLEEHFHFGKKVSLSGNLFAVSTYNNAPSAQGFVYRIENDEVVLDRVFLKEEGDGSYGSNMDIFGEMLFVQGTKSPVGDAAPGVTNKFIDVWQRDSSGSWNKSQRINPPLGAGQSKAFGNLMSYDSRHLAIGSPVERIPGPIYSGVVWMYEKNSSGQFEFKQKISPLDAKSEDKFGLSVVVKDNLLVVGAPQNDNENGQDAGAVYIYENQGGSWVLKKKFLLPGGKAGDGFGSAISLEGKRLLISRSAGGTAFILDL